MKMKRGLSTMPQNLKQQLNDFMDRLKGGNKKSPKEAMLILFLSGILIYVIFMPVDDGNKKTDSTEKTVYTKTEEVLYKGDDYKAQLEKELEEFLAEIEGMGKVKVLIYMRNSQEYIVEKDSPTTSSEGTDIKENTKDETTVYTVNESGEQVPFISQTISPDIDGVVVAAQGAGNENIRLQIVNLVKALYGIEANKVEVFILGNKS